MSKSLLLYLLRWQLSGPILTYVLIVLSNYPIWLAVIIANLIGGISFFPVDKYILRLKKS